MNYLLKRILVGVCIAIVMMMVHKVSHAANYGWKVSGTKLYPTPLAACQSVLASATVQYVTATNYNCMTADGTGSAGTAVSSGTCDAPSVLNPSTGACAVPPDPNKDASDSCDVGSHHEGAYMGSGKGGGVAQGCVDGPNPCTLGTYQIVTASSKVCVPETASCPSGQFRASDKSCNPNPVSCPGGGVAATADQCSKFVCPAGDVIEGPNYNTCTNPKLPAPVTNPSGGCPKGSINIGTTGDGTPMCKGTQTDTPLLDTTPPVKTTPPVTTTNADGTKTTSTTMSSKNADGSTTTVTSSCTPDASGNTSCVSSTSTSSNTAGSPGKSDGTPSSGGGKSTDPPKEMCAAHPNLNVCQNSQVTASGCAGGQTTTAVTGDAIQGAILRQMASDYCLNTVTSPSKDLGNNIMAGADPLQVQIDAAKTGTTVDTSTQGLDSSGFLANSCLSDRTISVAGHSVAVSFSAVCNSIGPLRFAVLACAFIVAYLLVSKSVLQG